MSSYAHQDLTHIIKGVHNKLRESYQATGDFDQVWNNHVADFDSRKRYASAMLRLATEVWDEKDSRISWTYKTCVDYFIDEGIKCCLLRELKIRHKWSPTSGIDLNYLCQLSEQENNYKNYDRKLQLLDVGSCYNPFSKFPIFECLAIDLTPAVKDVLQCDFLSLQILVNKDEVFDNAEQMVKYESFDIVVFSLVLEYLPAKEQRIQFCFKAWQVLQKNGLLIIITPDSKSLKHNAPMIKSWKKALETIGFIRVKYEKLTHLHCMAFRKTIQTLESPFCLKSLSDLMFIPQDFKRYDLPEKFLVRDDKENFNVIHHFSVLPDEYPS